MNIPGRNGATGCSNGFTNREIQIVIFELLIQKASLVPILGKPGIKIDINLAAATPGQ